MNKLLKLRSWKLFLLIYGPGIISFAVFISAFIRLSVPNITLYMTGITLTNTFFMIWAYLAGKSLYEKLPLKNNFQYVLYRFNILFVTIYMCLFSLLSIKQFSRMGLISGLTAVIPVLHMYGMFAGFYIMYFLSKTLVSVEKKTIAVFRDYAGEFFLLWFFPIGLWILQPRIAGVLEKNEEIDKQDTITET